MLLHRIILSADTSEMRLWSDVRHTQAGILVVWTITFDLTQTLNQLPVNISLNQKIDFVKISEFF